MNKKGSDDRRRGGGFGFIIFLIIILLIWGYVGGQKVKNSGVACDLGLGKNFCWKWHTQVEDQAKEFINETKTDLNDALSGN